MPPLFQLLFSLLVLDDLTPHLENPSSQIEMKFLLLEQKYLENLAAGNTIEALKVKIFKK